MRIWTNWNWCVPKRNGERKMEREMGRPVELICFHLKKCRVGWGQSQSNESPKQRKSENVSSLTDNRITTNNLVWVLIECFWNPHKNPDNRAQKCPWKLSVKRFQFVDTIFDGIVQCFQRNYGILTFQVSLEGQNVTKCLQNRRNIAKIRVNGLNMFTGTFQMPLECRKSNAIPPKARWRGFNGIFCCY